MDPDGVLAWLEERIAAGEIDEESMMHTFAGRSGYSGTGFHWLLAFGNCSVHEQANAFLCLLASLISGNV